MIAAKQFDPVLGVDIHIVQPPGPVPPIPIPHPFIGMVLDPMDFIPIIGGTVMVNGIPRATAGSAGIAAPPHIPIGGMFVKPPGNECEVFMGSATVLADDEPLSRLGMPALSCHDIGMPSPPRVKKKSKARSLFLPTSVVLSIPAGPPVLVGGPPTVSMMAIGMRLGMGALGKGLKKLKKTRAFKKARRAMKKARQKAFSHMKPGFLKCQVLKAEPVNVLTGEVVVEQLDFTLPWHIPLAWTRLYRSGSTRAGTCGLSWETPADARLELDADGIVTFFDGSRGASVFPVPPLDGPVMELVDGAVLARGADGGLTVRTREGLTYGFGDPATRREVPVAWIKDELGNRVRFTWGPAGLAEIADETGQRIVVRSEARRILSMTLLHPDEDEPRPLVGYAYDGAGLAVVYDALSQPYRFAYVDSRLARHTDRRGLSFHYAYDPEGRCIHAWGDGRLHDYRFEYGPSVTRAIDPWGAISVTEQRDGLPVRETDALGEVTAYEQDAAGRTSARTDPLGLRTEWEYDAAGNLVALTRPDGSRVVAEFDSSHRTVSLTSPGGRRTALAYQGGRLAGRTAPRGGRWTYEHDAHGDLVYVVDAGGVWKRLERDRYGRVVGLSDSAGRAHRLRRDALGNVIESETADGRRGRYTYDAKGRLLGARFGAGASIRCEYDAADNLVAYTDENGGTVRWSYTGLGNVAERTGADGGTVRYCYDAEERLAAVSNERGETFTIERDPCGRVVRETDYWGHPRDYAYDAAGRLVAITSALGERVGILRDALGRVVGRALPGNVVERFGYDPDGYMVWAAGPHGRVTRRFDPDGNLVEEASGAGSVHSEYDLAGRRIRRATSLGNTLDVGYGTAGLLSSLLLNGAPLARMEYDGRGRLDAEHLGPSLRRIYRYGADGRLLRQSLRAGGTVTADQEFRFDAAGNLVERRALDGDEATWEYDPAGRVRRMAGTVLGIQDLSYGPDGALLEPGGTAPAGAEARCASHGGAAYRFDAAGRLVSRTRQGAEARFTWDALNRLVACTTETGRRVEFAYDPLGRRIRKTVDGVSLRFAWDEDHLLAEIPDAGAAREFIFRPGGFEPVAAIGGGTRYFETDASGIPRLLVDEGGRAVWHGYYDALGRVGAVSLAEEEQPLRLQGQYFDVETGLAYNRHRYYDGHIGAFISQDPVRLSAGAGLYTYAPNVWKWVDLFGLNCKVYRVEASAGGNARVEIDGRGNVKIFEKDKYLYISFDNPAHAEYFLKKKRAEFPDSVIKTFDVPDDVADGIRAKAVYQHEKAGRDLPEIADPKVSQKLGMEERDVLGVKGDDLEALEANSIPGSGAIL